MLKRLLERVQEWLAEDHRRRIRQLNDSLDRLEERYVDVRADLFNKGRR